MMLTLTRPGLRPAHTVADIEKGDVVIDRAVALVMILYCAGRNRGNRKIIGIDLHPL